jgi:ubiquitin conjugation factor E4 B
VKPKINITNAPTLPTALSSKAPDLQETPNIPTVREIPAERQMKRCRAKSDGQASPRSNPPKKLAPASVDESIEAYENRTLGSIFRITLDPNQTVDSSNHKLIYLPNLRQELEDEQAPILLTKERLDSALLEAASAIPHSKGALDYLIPCWKRVMRTLKGLRGYASGKDAILKEAKRLCMSNCVFAVEMPEFFGSVIFTTLKVCG